MPKSNLGNKNIKKQIKSNTKDEFFSENSTVISNEGIDTVDALHVDTVKADEALDKQFVRESEASIVDAEDILEPELVEDFASDQQVLDTEIPNIIDTSDLHADSLDENVYDTSTYGDDSFDDENIVDASFDHDDFGGNFKQNILDLEKLDDDKVYAINSYDHAKDLPVPKVKHLPSTLIKDNLQLYIREVSRFPLLEPDEEVELARRVRDEGDSDAAFRIISSHLRLVVKVAMDFQRRWMQNALDLIQEGNVGLMRAVNKFDPDKGIKFSYYATFWIKAYILKYIMDNWRMVKIGTTQAQRKLFYNLNKEKQKLIAQGFDPDASSLSDALGVSVEQVVEMEQRLGTSDMSLDAPVNDEHGGSATRIDFFPALGPGIEDHYAESEIATLIQNSLAGLLPKLSEKERFILENRLLTDDPVTLREIGEKYKVTRERIRQLEARLLVKLRNHLGADIGSDFSESWINQ